MSSLKDFFKFSLAPKNLYLQLSARNKFRRAEKKGEVELRLLPFWLIHKS